ncbi:3-isopropylmalate dehydratase small subunit [Evansella sp. LMS18]|uniref:3-isopropylmalate dehydratase small subunit n=1 Tax=Evansella sp. LMS18 TaxID=2924033 RepID=UPI0020D0F4EA|nr:3-isopropylmalate dehydratase small subunit [Evansella sp. LMS18]UTR12056.1 3-isopropylmalate dehydratase small subunit [Evansella sp. LMS18]
MSKFSGRSWTFGDNIDTDVIVPGQYLKLTAEEVANHVMEGVDESFSTKVKQGDIVVGGKNFGCGSSRETAPAALKHAGVSAIISVFFARIFYRNAINIGLPVIEIKEAKEINEGDELVVNLKEGRVCNLTQNKVYYANPYPDMIIDILEHGGLLPLLKKSFGKTKNN